MGFYWLGKPLSPPETRLGPVLPAPPLHSRKVEFEHACIGPIVGSGLYHAADHENARLAEPFGRVVREPAWPVASCCNSFDAQAECVELENLGLAGAAQVVISKRPNEQDVATHERCRVKVRRRKHVLRVEEEFPLPTGVLGHDVIVDTEIWIVGILMLAGDVNDTPVRKRSTGAPVALPAPERPGRRVAIVRT